jgi:hypothetical protein
MRHTPTFPRGLLIATAMTIAASAPALAQDEAALKAFFEGRRVTVKIDMPGTSDGVDIRVDSNRPLDSQQYGERLKQYGAAIHAGDSATVTLVKLKKDLIEFQLGGGGFGTFGDDTDTSVNLPLMDKSQREKDLEKRIKEEDDSRRRKALEHDLSELRERREGENRRIEAARVVAEAQKREHLAEQRLRGGSRFNIRYDGAVPRDLRPGGLAAALAPFVDVSDDSAGAPEAARPPADAATAGDGAPRKGMLREEAERQLGRPSDASERREGTLTVVTLVFVRPGQRITAEFVDDVLIRYSIASR